MKGVLTTLTPPRHATAAVIAVGVTVVLADWMKQT